MKKIPLKTITANQLANEYGFAQHNTFIKFINQVAPGCILELQKAGWQWAPRIFYLPIFQAIIFKYLGSHEFKTSSKQAIAEAYGLSRFSILSDTIMRNEELMEKLKNKGFSFVYKKILPVWVEIIVEHLGTPENLHLLQK